MSSPRSPRVRRDSCGSGGALSGVQDTAQCSSRDRPRRLRHAASPEQRRERPLAVLVGCGRPMATSTRPRRRGGLVRGLVGAARVDRAVRQGRALSLPRDARRARCHRAGSRSRLRVRRDRHRSPARSESFRRHPGVRGRRDRSFRRVRHSRRNRLGLGADGCQRRRVRVVARSRAGDCRPDALREAEEAGGPSPSRRRVGLGVAAIVLACLLVLAHAIPLFAQREIGHSQAAVRRGDLGDALAAAKRARDIQPWAATPYLQLALVSEQAGALASARVWIDKAIARDRTDWRLWLASARIETRLGRVTAAERSLRRAVALNPRSPLLKGIVQPAAP